MAAVDDVAAYILRKHGAMSTWKLQKLVYYAQAWHLAWEEEPLFTDPIQAWANGPVVRRIYNKHSGRFTVASWPDGDARRLRRDERETIDAVIGSYGKLSGRQLSALTHSEWPWQEARRGLAPTARSTRHIKPETMREFYARLDADEDAEPVDSLRF